jgi:CRP-like cAMP-binding protein
MNLLNIFMNSENIVEYRLGEIIFSEGTRGEVMYVVLEGEVDVMVNDKLVDVIKPGNIFGEMAILDESFRSATTIAKTECRLATVDQRKFLYMVQQTPYFALEVMRVLANRLRNMNFVGQTKTQIQ